MVYFVNHFKRIFADKNFPSLGLYWFCLNNEKNEKRLVFSSVEVAVPLTVNVCRIEQNIVYKFAILAKPCFFKMGSIWDSRKQGLYKILRHNLCYFTWYQKLTFTNIYIQLHSLFSKNYIFMVTFKEIQLKRCYFVFHLFFSDITFNVYIAVPYFLFLVAKSIFPDK